jgi:hypothetical protein
VVHADNNGAVKDGQQPVNQQNSVSSSSSSIISHPRLSQVNLLLANIYSTSSSVVVVAPFPFFCGQIREVSDDYWFVTCVSSLHGY